MLKILPFSRVLVTGGAGFIGSNLVRRLVADGHTVDVVDNMANGSLENLEGLKYKTFIGDLVNVYEEQVDQRPKDQVWVIENDFASEAVLSRIHQKMYDTVFHQAAVPRVSYSVENPVETTDENLMKSVELLRACAGNIRRAVVASSSSVYGGADIMPTSEDIPKSPKSPYALQKSCLEEFASLFSNLYELDVVMLRYFNVFGPGQKGDSPYSTAVSAWCDAISTNRALRSDGDGSQSRDMCYVDNIVDANILSAFADKKFSGERYNICCGERTTNRQVLDFLRERYPGVKIVDAPWRPGDVMHTLGDYSAAQRDFGYVPKVTFWDGLEKTLKWWKLA
jgi:nucleoside-diphosphate-sugar epimerase